MNSFVLLVVLKWNWKMFFWPSASNICAGISCGSAALCWVMSSEHEYPVTSSVAGVKKVNAPVADWVTNALKLYLCVIE